ncbi:hypothetical protein TrVFT333_002440 [Trichoderma virens FT-333]|nr:hypothetical protein TrVFT333_002440 [Trichoderma virens FT-333]
MTGKDLIETTDIIVCGCGPTGAMLSVLLSQYSISHVILEKENEVNADPRGIALDEDGIRYLQACGIYDKIFTEIGQCMGNFKFIGKEHHDLTKKPFMMMDYSTTEGGTGHPGFMCHKQPCVEKHLRSQITALGVAEMHLGAKVTSIWEDEDWVYARYTNTSNQGGTVRGKFLIGADGKTGFTRKQYLEPQGITLDQAMRMPYEETWVALNWKISLPTPKTHPDFPFGRRGIRPSKSTMSFFPLTSDSCFVVRPGEDPGDMAKPNQIAKVVHPYITHPGSRYGLNTKQIIYPLDCVEVLRCRPFKFSARSCNKWSLGRVVLCGDAAHVFPPFGGQGIASAFRDAISLVWRLRIATNVSSRSGEMLDYRTLLQGWYVERKQQLDKSLRSTVENGNYVTESSNIKIFLRDWYLWLIQLVPSWKHWLQLGNRRDGMVRYQWQEGMGMAFLPRLGGGGNFPQVYAVSVANTPRSEKVLFTDDIIFSPQKQGLFQVVVILQPHRIVDGVDAALRGLQGISNGAIRDGEATVFINTTKAAPCDLKGRHVYRLATAAEFADDPVLSAGRPEPKGYDPHRMSKEVGNKTFVILRPDRFVFAACDTRSDLVYAAETLRRLVATGTL